MNFSMLRGNCVVQRENLNQLFDSHSFVRRCFCTVQVRGPARYCPVLVQVSATIRQKISCLFFTDSFLDIAPPPREGPVMENLVNKVMFVLKSDRIL